MVKLQKLQDFEMRPGQVQVITNFYSSVIPDDQFFVLSASQIVVNGDTYEKLRKLESGSQEFTDYIRSMTEFMREKRLASRE